MTTRNSSFPPGSPWQLPYLDAQEIIPSQEICLLMWAKGLEGFKHLLLQMGRFFSPRWMAVKESWYWLVCKGWKTHPDHTVTWGLKFHGGITNIDLRDGGSTNLCMYVIVWLLNAPSPMHYQVVGAPLGGKPQWKEVNSLRIYPRRDPLPKVPTMAQCVSTCPGQQCQVTIGWDLWVSNKSFYKSTVSGMCDKNRKLTNAISINLVFHLG